MVDADMDKLRKGISRIEKDHGWLARHYHKNEEHPQFFADSKYVGREKAYKAACSHLDFLDEIFPPGPKPFKITRHFSKKDDLPVGVYESYTINRAGNKDPRFMASWVNPNTKRKKVKSFNYRINDPEDRERKRAAAIKWRKDREAEVMHG